MSVLQPRELWQESGRDEDYGEGMFRLRDRRDRELVLAPTHEELLTTMVRANVKSYRDLPLILYQIQTKFRDEPRPRGGLLRVREFDMKDAYSFDVGQEELDASYDAMERAYKRIYARCGLDAIMVEADSGTIGGRDSQEFILVADSGEDTVMICEGCGYAANAEKAVFVKPPPGGRGSEAHRDRTHARPAHHRRPGPVPGRAPEQDPEGRVLRRRRPGRVRHHPRRPGGQRGQAAQRPRRRSRPAPGLACRGTRRRSHRGLGVSRRTVRHQGRGRRLGDAGIELRGWGQPGGLPLAQRQLRARLRGRCIDRHRPCRGGLRLREVRRALQVRPRHRGGPHIQAGHQVQRGPRRRLPRRERGPEAHRHGLLRHWGGPPPWPRRSSRTTTRTAWSFLPASPPSRCCSPS